MLIKSKHTSVLEHGTVYLRVGKYDWDGLFSHIEDYRENPYSNVNWHDGYYITTNLRVLQENGWIDDLDHLCEPTEFHEKRLSVKVVTSRGISHELVRHRGMSFIQESQRYCNYSNGKHGDEITCIIPSWFPENTTEISLKKMIEDIEFLHKIEDDELRTKMSWFTSAIMNANLCYDDMINSGCTAQQARDVLPNATKTTLVITAFESDWREWFAQRLFGKTGTPHPDMLVLANLIKQEFEKAGVWEGIMKYPSKYD
jgi:thymidylate synthase (FAD)